MPASVHVALLRGINVGGKNKVEMPRLRTTFEAAGLERVSTYINTGNVIFAAPEAPDPGLLQRAIRAEFDLDVPVLVRSKSQIQQVVDAVPSDWTNGEHMKCDVMFLWDEVDHADIVERVDARQGIDDVRYLPGALVWKVDRDVLTRSRMSKLVGTRLYRSMTVRNINTVRKLADLMDQI